MKKEQPTLGGRIDQIKAIDDKIKAAEKIVKGLKQLRAKKEVRLLKKFNNDDIDGCKGKRGTARVRKATFFSIKDRKRFEKYVLKNKALDLFQNRISSTAYKARLDEGEAVPGIASFERIGVTVTARRGG